jgi:TolB protein
VVFLGEETRCQELACVRFARSWIFTIEADGDGLRRITRGIVVDWDPAWSPDGETIAFARVEFPLDADPDTGPTDPRILGVSPDDGDIRVVGSIGVIGASDLAWSPDGSTLAFTTTGSDIALLDLASGRITTLVPARAASLRRPYGNGSPAWSPDGRRLVFVRDHEDGYDLYIVDTQGGSPRKLTEGNDPSWLGA